MKIAYLSNGIHYFDSLFLGKMVEKGHQPHLISYWPAEVSFSLNGAGFTHYDARYPRLPRVVAHLRHLLKQTRPDVLHAGWVQTNGFYAALAGFHPMLLMPWGSDILLEPHSSYLKKLVTRFTLRRADMITCDCQAVKDSIIRLAGYPAERIVVFPWGVDLDTFRPAPDPGGIRRRLGWEDKLVLVMNRSFARPIYGILYFIESLPEVIRALPATRVLLIGSGGLEDVYRRRVQELDLVHYVSFISRVNPGIDMAQHLQASDAYVSSSLSDGTSVSLLEAMACGLPVVVSDVPANLEWVQNGYNGMVVPRQDSARLASAVIALLKDRGLRKDMGERNRAIAEERADWEKNFRVLESIFARLTGHN